MAKKVLPLTPLEAANAEKAAYEAFLRQQAIYNPPPKPATRDLVHDNPHVVRALAWAVSVIPVFLALIMFTAVFISADRTFAAFQGAAAHQAIAWSSFIGLLGVIFSEGSLVFAEFAAVRTRLQKGLKRQVLTLPKLWQGMAVRLGLREPLDYDEMPDTNLERFAKMVFVLVLAANIFVGVMPLLETNGTSWAMMSDLARLKLGFAIFMGVVAPFGLKFVGGQLAELSYSLYATQRQEMTAKLYDQWRHEARRLWEQEAPRIIAQALHQRFITKNGLPMDTESEYLLMAGSTGEGEAAVEAVPLGMSWEPLPEQSPNTWRPATGGNQKPPATP